MSVRLLFRTLKTTPPVEIPDEKGKKEELFQDFYRANFGKVGSEEIDKNLSVYYIEPSELIRVVSEHYSSDTGSSPARRYLAIIKKLPNDCIFVDSPGRTLFEFSNDRHRELVFKRDIQVEQFAMALFNEITSCNLSLPPVIQYKLAAHLVQTRNPNWSEHYKAKTFHERWLRAIDLELGGIT